MNDFQKGYQAYFNGTPCLSNRTPSWLEGWKQAAADLEAANEHHYDDEITNFGYGDV